MTATPMVSVILPCRDEARFLGPCLDSILANDYPKNRVEILVADGRSTDRTRELLESYSDRFSAVRLIDNPMRIAAAGLNRAIEAASGEIIIRLDAHATVASNYIQLAVTHLQRNQADNVGGAMRTVARDRGYFAKAIRAVLAHPFGVGNSHFRTNDEQGEPRWVDTVFGGCWRKEVFDRVGKFNEQLVRGQDMEFNLRLAKAGGRILLVPAMMSYYFARATFPEFVRHNWSNGIWAILPFAYSDVVPVRLRHLAPLAFASALLLSVIAALAGAPSALLAILLPYVLIMLAATAQIAIREREWALAGLLPIAFATLHLSYGGGSLAGTVGFIAISLRRFAAKFTK